uniref:ATP synthase complex subunit 8 n=2 Tax=Ampittia TaxID=509333 RepID=A0A8F4XMG9_9NEOP|nr:ATP synthase F0 subunit 8 [Ampittia dioscorides]QXI88788.1 ATP synthase F0 subunit 8 [Ampittia virgata]
MPQMMPINWIISFILFILIFMMYNIINYYIFTLKPKKKIIFFNLIKNKLIWKW